MPPPAKAENARHPLKLLRFLLSPNPDRPISQTQLAKLVDGPLNSIKLAEHGQRSIGKTLLARIRLGVGAVWNDSANVWESAFRRPDDSTILYSYEIYVQYKALISALPSGKVRKKLENNIERQIKLLLAKAPDDRWWLLIFRLLEDMEAARVDFLPNDYNDEFGSTELHMITRYDDATGKPLAFQLAGRIYWVKQGNPQLDAWSGKDPIIEQVPTPERMSRAEFDALPGKSFPMSELPGGLAKLTKRRKRKP
jgi:hypothetical protein